MANRTFNRPRALEKELIILPFQFGIDSSAAVVASSLLGRGFVSVTKLSTGLYKVVLQDPYVALISCSLEILTANASTQAVQTQIGDYNITANAAQAAAIGLASASSLAAQSFHVRTVNNAGAVADASVAGTIMGLLLLRNSGVV